MNAQELGNRPAMNANAIGIIGSIVDAHIAECTEPKPCAACAADREAFGRLVRLVEAVAYIYGESCYDQCPLGCPSCRICKALSDVLGEGE